MSQLINQVGEYLETRNNWVSTTTILNALNIPKTNRWSVLTVLHHLGSLRMVGRFGTAKYKWKMSEEQKIAWRAVVAANPAPENASSQSEQPVAAPADTSALIEQLRELQRQVAELAARPQTTGPVDLVVNIPERQEPVTLENVVVPENFQIVLDLAAARKNILLVGPTGCGKTHLSKLVADALDLPFASLSCTAGMGESHIIGRSVPNLTTGEDIFKNTDFLRMYENGGVFLADEIDSADPNLLLVMNTAIANGYCSVPARSENPVAKRHPDFVIIASANTYGHGPDRVYAGRNQLDEASLDRFRIGTVACDYSETIEAALCPDDSLRAKLLKIRTNIAAHGLRRVMSTRFMQDAYEMRAGSNWNDDQIFDRFFEGWTTHEKEKVLQGVK